MSVTANDQYMHAPRISRERFGAILRERANPGVVAERDPGAYYDAIANRGVDPLFVLAMFNHESSMGKAGVAITTHSWGNTRTPNFGAIPIGTVPGRTGTFPVWRDWLDGCISTAARLATPDYYYFGERRTIGQVFNDPVADHPGHEPALPPVPRRVVNGRVQRIEWAPAGDLNNPAGYLRSMLDFMNDNMDTGEPPMAGDDSRFQWIEERAGEIGYPQGSHGRRQGRADLPHHGVTFGVDLLVLHITIGHDSLDYLLNANGNSAHYLTHKNGTPRAQTVRDADAAWAAGHYLYNLRGIQVEHEKRLVSDPWTDEMYANLAATCHGIATRHNIPLVYLGRDNGIGKRGFIGHSDVPDPDGTGWGGDGNHTDPGANFDWPRFMALVNALEGGTQPPAGDGWYLHLGGGKYAEHPYILGFRGVVEGLARSRFPNDPNSAALALFGPPEEPEWRGTDGRVYQRTRKAVLVYTPGNAVPWDVALLDRDAVLPERAA